MALPGDREGESQLAVDRDEKQSSLEGDVNGAAGGSSGRVSWPWAHMKAKLTEGRCEWRCRGIDRGGVSWPWTHVKSKLH